jgi:hypothetical protein
MEWILRNYMSYITLLGYPYIAIPAILCEKVPILSPSA